MMNGKNSDFFRYFKSLLLKGLTALQKEVEEIVTIIEMMMEDSDLPCFEKFDLKEFRARFYENATDNEVLEGLIKLNRWVSISND